MNDVGRLRVDAGGAGVVAGGVAAGADGEVCTRAGWVSVGGASPLSAAAGAGGLAFVSRFDSFPGCNLFPGRLKSATFIPTLPPTAPSSPASRTPLLLPSPARIKSAP
jgi:hypothetical protein